MYPAKRDQPVHLTGTDQSSLSTCRCPLLLYDWLFSELKMISHTKLNVEANLSYHWMLSRGGGGGEVTSYSGGGSLPI